MIFFKKYHKIFALLLFSMVSVLYFGPGLINHLNTRFSGIGADKFIYVWNLAWWPHALLHHLNPFLPSVVWHPSGINLAKIGSMPGLALALAPITLLFGAIVSYNLLAIFSSAFAAWTAYLLGYYIFKSIRYALITGYLFGYSGFVLAQMLGHLPLASAIFLIPISVLLFLQYFDKKIGATKFVCLFTLTLTSLFLIWSETFMTFTFWGGISFFIALKCFSSHQRELMRCIKPMVFAYLLTAVIISPYLYYFFTDTLTMFAVNSPSYFANDFFGPFIPSSLFLFNDHVTSYLSSKFTGNQAEQDLYFGLGLITIVIIFIKKFWQTPLGKYLTLISFIFIIASLGPVLHILGKSILPFPWHIFFTKVPILHAALPSRLAVFADLSIAIIAALWVKNSPWRPSYRLLFLALTILFLLPSLDQTKRPTVSTEYTPAFFRTPIYKNYLTAQDNLLIFPYEYGAQLWWQVQTHFSINLAGGYLGPLPYLFANDPIFLKNFIETPCDPKNLKETDLVDFIDRHSITKIIIVKGQGYDAWNSLLIQLDPHPILIDGVTIYDTHPLPSPTKETL